MGVMKILLGGVGALLLLFWMMPVKGALLTNSCGNSVNLTVFTSENFQDDLTPTNRTIPFSINIPLVFQAESSDNNFTITYDIEFNDSVFNVTDVVTAINQGEGVINREKFDLEFDTDYTVTLNLVNSSGDNCNVSYPFTIDRSGLQEEKSLSVILAFVTLFGLSILLFMIGTRSIRNRGVVNR